MIAGTPLEGDAQGHGRSRRGAGGDVGVPGGRGGLDKAGVEAEGRTAPLVAAFVKAFTAAKQAAFNDHEGTATSSQQKVGGPSWLIVCSTKLFEREPCPRYTRGSSSSSSSSGAAINQLGVLACGLSRPRLHFSH